jgi:hypothetical protein
MKDGAALHFQRRARMVREDEDGTSYGGLAQPFHS